MHLLRPAIGMRRSPDRGGIPTRTHCTVGNRRACRGLYGPYRLKRHPEAGACHAGRPREDKKPDETRVCAFARPQLKTDHEERYRGKEDE